jgi:hypothetical protein
VLEVGRRRRDDVTRGDVSSNGGAPADLIDAWSDAVIGAGWVSPGDWWHPSVEPAAVAVLTGGDPCPALARLGGARAQAGVSMDEALTEIAALYEAAGSQEPPFDAVRAYVSAYGERVLDAMTLDACEDPLTGLTTVQYLHTRLGEVYRDCDRDGVAVEATSALVVAESAADRGGRLMAAVTMIEIADAMRTVFSGGETCAALTPWRAVALVPRRPELPRSVHLLQELLAERRRRAGDARVWIERLPAHEAAGADLVTELSRT